MSKGVYCFLAYPESSDIGKIKDALSAMGCDYNISPLHDKDTKEDGTLKKAHYHVLCGFKKNMPEYSDFKDAIKDIGGVVPPYQECLVHDAEAAEDYQSHDGEAGEGKAEYNAEDIVKSETWNVQNYITYLDKRSKAHEKNQKHLQEVIVYISKTKCSFSELVDNFVTDGEILSVILKNAYALTQYIRCINKTKGGAI